MDKMVATLTLEFPAGEPFVTQKSLAAVWALKFEVGHSILSLVDASLDSTGVRCNHPKGVSESGSQSRAM
jgi:hypothetical protein